MSYDARREVKEATRVGDTFIFMTLSDHCPYLDGLGRSRSWPHFITSTNGTN